MKVTIVDASIDVGKSISEGLAQKEGFLTAFYSGNPENIFDKIVESKPDVVVLDIDLPNLTGIQVLSNLMKYNPLPIILTCYPTQKGKLNIVEGMELGAIDFISKPTSNYPNFLDEFIAELSQKLRIAKQSNITALKQILDKKIEYNFPKEGAHYSKNLIVMGLGNMALEAFRKIISNLPSDFPCIIAVLDMPAGFTKLFADRLNEVSNLEVKEAIEKDELTSGRVLIAQGGFHIKIPEFREVPYVEVFISEKMNHKRPSIDVLMLSVAEHIGKNAVGVLMSGSGEDGVLGMKAMKMSGANTIITRPDLAIHSDRLIRAEKFSSNSYSVSFEEFPKLLFELTQE